MNINTIQFKTPLGPMIGCATTTGVCLLDFVDQSQSEIKLKDLCKKLNGVISSSKNAYLEQLQTELEEYFKGIRKIFSVPLHIQGTEFQEAVWRILQTIPYGHTWSYKEQALKLNHLKAIRAVASANGKNRIAILIPCHRVIGSNGDLIGYASGLDRKKYLLDLEKQ